MAFNNNSISLATTVILSLSILLAIPTAYVSNVHAVVQCCPNATFSTTGPRQTIYVWKVYATDAAIFNDFDLGLLDIVDGPDLFSRLNCATNPACDESNPNYYVSNAQPGFDINQLDISHQVTFLGLPEFCSRVLGAVPVSSPTGFACTPGFAPQPASITINSDSVAACGGVSSNQFSLTVHLKNFEENLALITDPYETLIATPTAGTAASAQSSTGTYALGCLSSIPPTYAISTAVYGDLATKTTAQVSLSTTTQCLVGLACDVDLRVDYNSPSNKEPTTAMTHIARALGHLVDKPIFTQGLQGAGISSTGACIDVYASPAQLIMNSIADPTLACSLSSEVTGPGSPAAAAKSLVPNAAKLECTELATANFPITTCNPVSLYNLQLDPNISACDATTAGACPTNSLGVQIPGTVGGFPVFPSAGRLGNDAVIHLPTNGYEGTIDLTAACDEFVLAGVPLSAGATCNDVALGNVVGGATAHLNAFCAGTNTKCQISFVMRKRNLSAPGRPEWSTIQWDELNFLFGTGAPGGGTLCGGTLSPTPGLGATCSVTTSAPQYYTIGQIGGTVFQAAPTWNLYSGAESIGSTPDAVLFSTHSQFASNFCGNPVAATFPADYDLWCDPITDTQATAGEYLSSPLLTASLPTFQNTALATSTRGLNIPIYTPTNRYVALNAWNTESLGTKSSLVPATGHGFEAGTPGSYFSLLNMQPSGLVTSGTYQAGGGVAGLVRRSSGGASAGVLHQNIFTSTTIWEADLTQEIWDSMLQVDPLTAGSNLQLIDWMTKSHSSQFDARTGLNTQVWNLRSDLCWQDATVGPVPAPGLAPCTDTANGVGYPVTADDVCFTIGTEERGAGLNFIGVQDVVSCTYPDALTVVVVHNRLSIFQLLNIGSQPILPAHIWQTACGWVAASHAYTSLAAIPATVVNAPCTQAGFDPMAVTFNGAPFSTPLPPNVVGMMVGSGPLMCVTRPGFPIPGLIGGGCAVNAAGTALSGQALAVGSTETLVRFPFYMRCCDTLQGSSDQSLSWADFDKDGKVTITDAAALSFVFGTNDAIDGGYFVSPLYGIPGSTVVDIGDAAFLANQFDSGLIAPCIAFQCPGPPEEPSPAAPLLSPDPAIDPYKFGSGVENLGCVANAVRTAITCAFADKSNQLGGVSGQLDAPSGPSVSGVHQLNGQTTYTFAGSFRTGSHSFSIASLNYSYSFSI